MILPPFGHIMLTCLYVLVPSRTACVKNNKISLSGRRWFCTYLCTQRTTLVMQPGPNLTRTFEVNDVPHDVRVIQAIINHHNFRLSWNIDHYQPPRLRSSCNIGHYQPPRFRSSCNIQCMSLSTTTFKTVVQYRSLSTTTFKSVV